MTMVGIISPIVLFRPILTFVAGNGRGICGDHFKMRVPYRRGSFSPTPIPFGELYTALSQGTVDGAENNLPSFGTGRHMEVCKYFTFSEHVMVPDLLVVSRATWDSLSEEERRWLQTAADEYVIALLLLLRIDSES